MDERSVSFERCSLHGRTVQGRYVVAAALVASGRRLGTLLPTRLCQRVIHDTTTRKQTPVLSKSGRGSALALHRPFLSDFGVLTTEEEEEERAIIPPRDLGRR